MIVASLGSDEIAAVAKEQLAEVGIRFNIRQGGPTFWDTVYLHEPFILPDWNRRPPFEIYGLLTTTENMSKLESPICRPHLIRPRPPPTLLARRPIRERHQITADQDGYILPAYAPRLHAKATKLEGVQPNFTASSTSQEPVSPRDRNGKVARFMLAATGVPLGLPNPCRDQQGRLDAAAPMRLARDSHWGPSTVWVVSLIVSSPD